MNATVPRNLASPEETEARRKRIAEANEKAATRLSEMFQARATRRKHGVRNAWELFTEVNNLIASMPCLQGTDLARYRDELTQFASNLEDDLTNHTPA